MDKIKWIIEKSKLNNKNHTSKSTVWTVPNDSFKIKLCITFGQHKRLWFASLANINLFPETFVLPNDHYMKL